MPKMRVLEEERLNKIANVNRVNANSREKNEINIAINEKTIGTSVRTVLPCIS